MTAKNIQIKVRQSALRFAPCQKRPVSKCRVKKKDFALFPRVNYLRLLFSVAYMLVSASTNAHHDVSSDIDLDAPIEIVGQVVGVEWESPHATLQIEIERATGANQVWLVQVDSPRELVERAFSSNTVSNLNFVAVVMYLSLSNSCDDECFGYGLSLTDPAGNTYTLSSEISSMLTELKVGD